MDKFDRFQRFHRILATRRRPIPLVELANELECSSKTAQRTIEQMRDYWQAPIEYSREHRGYYYSDDKFTLPGLWLTTGELQSLTFLLSVVEEIDEGLLHEEVSTVMTRLRTLLAARNIDDAELASRIRILPLGKRYIPGRTFLAVGAAILSRKRLWIRYCDYQGRTTAREVSPQTLVHYRENWYLDAWCHLRQDLRTFSLSRMLAVELRNEKPLDIDQGKLREHFTRSYGLFAGKASHQARLRFFPAIAREIASQEWHPEQQGTWDGDDYVLSLPYSDPTELIQDILRHVPHVYVETPAALRKKVQNRLHAGLELFAGKRIRRP